jgi:type II secretory pathway predicted ATPase ExeA
VWMHHWGLARHPFAGPDSPFVSVPAHAGAVARLTHAIETAQPLITLTAEAGLGKSTVLRQALSAVSSPWRRLALVNRFAESAPLLSTLARRLGEPVEREPSRQMLLSAISRACRLAGLQRFHVVLAIDDWHSGGPANLRQDVAALLRMRESAAAGLTAICVDREERLDSAAPIGWTALAIGLEPLTRSQTERFLTEKLARAGSAEPIFTPRAITRLHGWSKGVPREAERLATFALTAGAARGLEAIAPDLVDEAAASCGHVPSLATRWPQAVPG